MITTPWIEALGWTLTHSIWQASVTAVFLWCFLRLSRIVQPQTRYAASCVCLLVVVVFAASTFARELSKTRSSPMVPQLFALSNRQPELSSTPTAPSATTPLVVSAPKAPTGDATPSPALSPTTIWNSMARYFQSCLPWIVAIWGLGVTLCSFRLWKSWRIVQGLRGCGTDVGNSEWTSRFTRLCTHLGITRSVQFLASAKVDVPMVIGWLKPAVLLPCSVLSGLSCEQVEAIVAHELAHIRRHDYLVNLLQNAVETVFFFHPAVWWISGQIREEREHCCDDLASATIGGALTYARALTALEECRRAGNPLVIAANGGTLLSRVRRLLRAETTEGPGRNFLGGALAMLILITLIFTSVTATRAARRDAETSPANAANAQYAAAETGKREGSDAPSPAAKATPGETRTALPAAKHEQSRELLRLWRGEHPDAAAVPAEAMQRLAKQVKEYIERTPGPNADKFRELLPRLEADRAWPWPDAAVQLDQLCDIATAPVGWTELREQFRAFNRVKKGDAWTAEALAAIPFGPPNAQGLRAAWIFQPMHDTYAIGDVLKARILFHNAGKEPIEFKTDVWHQDDCWNVVDASGTARKVKTTRYTGITPLQRLRLEPGQVAEVGGHGVGIGNREYSEAYSVGAIGAEMPANPGDELRCTWEVAFQSADSAVDSKLRTGEVKFRVVPADLNAPKPPGVTTGTGRFDLAPNIKLQVTQVTSGKDGEPTKRDNTATILWFDDAKRQTLDWPLQLPPGLGTFVIAWRRGGSAFWIGKSDSVQKIDFSNAKDVRVESWKWEDQGDFGGIPDDVRAALLKKRPKTEAAAKPASPAPAKSAENVKPWKATGRVRNNDGMPMPDVEIWVHAGQGSLFRTGLAKTNADGRYEVEFTPGVMMEKDSPQLQFANITAHKTGFYETNLNRHGAGAAAMRAVSEEDLKGYGVTSAALVLPDKPREVNFQMAKAIKVKGRLLGTGSFPRLPPQDYRGKEEKPIAGHTVLGQTPLTRWKVWLTGPKLAPATGVFASAETDQEGRFEFADIPPGFEWQVQADSHDRGNDPRSPLFRPAPDADTVLVLELEEAQKELKILPPQKKDGASAEGAGDVQRWPVKLVDGETGAPVPDASIRVFALPGEAKVERETILKPGPDGLVEIPFVAGKTGAIQVAAPGRWTNAFIWLGADAKGMPDKDARPDPAKPIVVQLWRGTTVTGRLLSPEGDPMPSTPLMVGVYINNQEWKERLGMDLSHYSWDHGDWPNWSTSAVTKEDGTFETVVPSPDARSWVRVGTTQLGFGSISPVGADRAIRDFVPFESERQQDTAEKLAPLPFGDLRLEKGVTLRGRVLDANGKPLAGVHLFTSGPRGPYAGRTTVSSPDGRYEFQPMKPGSFTLSPDARIRKSGEVDSRDVQAVFLPQPVTLEATPNPMELTVQALPHVELVFEWMDRRAKKGPVSYYGEFALNGGVKVTGGEEVRWRGATELVEREGRKVLVVKAPRDLINPTLDLVADSVVTASYEDDYVKKSEPGPVALENLNVPTRRVIFGDEPKSRP